MAAIPKQKGRTQSLILNDKEIISLTDRVYCGENS